MMGSRIAGFAMRMIRILLATAILTFASVTVTPTSIAPGGPQSFYFHNATFNVTANGTYEAVTVDNQPLCDVKATITHGNQTTPYSLTANLAFSIVDCTPSFSLTNLTGSPQYLAGYWNLKMTGYVVASDSTHYTEQIMTWYTDNLPDGETYYVSKQDRESSVPAGEWGITRHESWVESHGCPSSGCAVETVHWDEWYWKCSWSPRNMLCDFNACSWDLCFHTISVKPKAWFGAGMGDCYFQGKMPRGSVQCDKRQTPA